MVRGMNLKRTATTAAIALVVVIAYQAYMARSGGGGMPLRRAA